MITLMAVTSGVSLISLVIWEMHQKNPIVDLPLLKIPSFLGAFLSMFAMGFILFGTTALLPQFLEQLLGYTAEQAGMALTAGGIFLMFVMPLVGGVLIPRFDARLLIVTGLLIQAASLFHVSHFNLGISFDQAVAARVYQVAGVALVFAPITQAAYNGLPFGKNNNASALINLARNLGGSVGIAISSTILAQRSQFHQARIVEHVSLYDPATVQALSHWKQLFPGQGDTNALGYIYNDVQRQAGMLGYIDIFTFMTVVTLLVIPFAFLIRGKKKDAAPPPEVL